MEEQKNPKVFISHSSADKQRFVTAFAKELRNSGIDAWMDEWEIRGGDSIAQKIQEGIEGAETMIIVFSTNSINSSWVNLEFESAIEQQVKRGVKIIPVVLDLPIDQIPVFLRTKKCIKGDDKEQCIKEILDSILNRSIKPPIGNIPEKGQDVLIEGLDKQDTLIFKKLCEILIEHQSDSIYFQHESYEVELDIGFSHDEIAASIDYLEGLGVLTCERYANRHVYNITISEEAFEKYLLLSPAEYENNKIAICNVLVNPRNVLAKELSKDISVPLAVVRHDLMILEKKKGVRLYKLSDGDMIVEPYVGVIQRIRDAEFKDMSV